MKPCRLLALTATFLALTSAHAVEDGFKSIFNGKTLDGWEGHESIWSVQDGAITGQTKADTGLKHNTFLVWKGGAVGDFELRLSYKIVAGNSGIQYRSKVAEHGAQGPIVGGYQADFEAGKTYSGILYEERGRGILAQRGQKTRITMGADGKTKIEPIGSVGKSEEIQAKIKDEDWNNYVVIAKGNHLQHFINGVPTVDVVDEDTANAAKSGVLAFQVHVGPPMVVQFKDVRVKNLGGESAAVGGSDLDRLQGVFVPVAGIRNGEVAPADELELIRLTIKGEKYEVALPDGGDEGKFTLKETTTPRQMDVVSDSSGLIEAIYELRSDGFRVGYSLDGAGRPKDFEQAAGPSYLLMTYRKK